MDRGSQYLGYDFRWHITQDTLLTSEWGTPNQIENGVIPEELLQGRYGHQVHVWDLRKRRHGWLCVGTNLGLFGDFLLSMYLAGRDLVEEHQRLFSHLHRDGEVS